MRIAAARALAKQRHCAAAEALDRALRAQVEKNLFALEALRQIRSNGEARGQTFTLPAGQAEKCPFGAGKHEGTFLKHVP